jgi:hypothetical protein
MSYRGKNKANYGNQSRPRQFKGSSFKSGKHKKTEPIGFNEKRMDPAKVVFEGHSEDQAKSETTEEEVTTKNEDLSENE